MGALFSSTNLDRADGSMAATAEKRQADDHFGSESLWIPAGGAARDGEKRRRRREQR